MVCLFTNNMKLDCVAKLAFVVVIACEISFTLCKKTKKNQQNIQTFLENGLDELESKGRKCNLKKITSKSVNNLRWTKSTNDVISCTIQLLLDNKGDGFLWSTLADLYLKKQQLNNASFCFKTASKISGKVTSFIKEWHYLGPFVIGKNEFDGDPVEAFGGIQNISKYREQKNQKFYSELSPGGEISWQIYHQRQPKDVMKIAPSINWNELVSTLSSVGITEWQGWVVGEFSVNEDNQNIVVQCLGHHTVYIDRVPVTGDVYQRNQFYFGISLNKGIHNIYVRLRGKVGANLMCNFQAKSSSFDILVPHFIPDILDGHIFGNVIPLPVTNYHSSKWLKILKVKLMDQSVGPDMTFELVDQVTIAPGQTFPVTIKFDSESRLPCEAIHLQLKLMTSEGTKDFSLSLRSRKLQESFLFTFIDHDGSVQQAAAVYPLSDCNLVACPVVLTLHGTTVPPQNQADSYKYMVDGKFVFGVNGAWLLAPTRHGAHNWEGPGVLTAMKALETLSQMAKDKTWIALKADAERVVFAGHSMGGHGSMNLATHYPDRALALISLAGWIKKEDYGDSNLFFRHDISTSHVDPSVKSILEMSVTENDVDRHVSNLKDIPVLIRTGAVDRTVPPFYLRRMYRLLREIGNMVNYTEPKDKEHWWWDTKETNDGGVVNDQYIRDFTERALQQSTGYCDGSEGCQNEKDNKYTKPDRKEFTYTCINPAFGEGLQGFKVIQQQTPFRLSTIKGHFENHEVKLSTVNVIRFSYKHNTATTIEIDNTSPIELTQDSTKGTLHFCRKTDVWEICSEDLGSSRGPDTYGPAKKIAEKKFLIVIGTTGDDESVTYIQQFAVYIANLFFLTSDTTALIVKDKDLENTDLNNYNLIVIGSPSQNSITSTLLKNTPVKINDGSFSIAECAYNHQRSGILTLAPNGDKNLALILSGNSFDGLFDVVSIATPTIPPMTRSPFSNLLPDYVVTGPEYGLKGPGGFLCVGFWGNNWEYRVDTSSCFCT